MGKAMINVEGNKPDTTGNVEELRESIVWIMETAFDTHMSEDIVLRAIDVLGAAAKTGDNNVTIRDSQFTSHDLVKDVD